MCRWHAVVRCRGLGGRGGGYGGRGGGGGGTGLDCSSACVSVIKLRSILLPPK